jgi:hypothetical protein
MASIWVFGFQCTLARRLRGADLVYRSPKHGLLTHVSVPASSREFHRFVCGQRSVLHRLMVRPELCLPRKHRWLLIFPNAIHAFDFTSRAHRDNRQIEMSNSLPRLVFATATERYADLAAQIKRHRKRWMYTDAYKPFPCSNPVRGRQLCSAAHISRSRSAVQITGHSMPRASS